jgi:trk system potassium uptake protein TrkA
VRLVGVIVEEEAPMANQPASHLQELLPEVEAFVATIYRKDKPVVHSDIDIIKKGDIVYYIAARENTVVVMEQFHQRDKPSKHVMIAGGGNIGMALAQRLESKYNVKLIEKSLSRAEHLAENLDGTMVLNGDVADQELLVEENISAMGLFCALTNDDEANILSAMVARKMGARKVMSLINRHAYVELVENGFIDVAISPHNVTIGALLRHVRRGDVVAVHSLRRGSAEALEAIAHGDQTTSEVVGRSISELPLPSSSIIGAIVRNGEVLIASDDLVIEAEDHVIVLVVNKGDIHGVEDLFQVGVTY